MTPGSDTESARTAAAHSAARERLGRQRELLRPLGWAVVAVVAATALTTPPGLGLRGASARPAAVVAGYAVATGVTISDRFVDFPGRVQVAVIALMGGAGVALVALQPRGATGLAVGAAVWMAMTRLGVTAGVVLGATLTAAEDGAALAGGAVAAGVLAVTLVNTLLGLVAYVVRAARVAQDRTELLLAELADARDEQTRAAALAERSRIAADLHDVLAHCLSGAAIQLQGARLLAARGSTEAPVRDAVERASELVNDGLVNARVAVGALRGEPLPGTGDLETLVAEFGRDLLVHAAYVVQGEPRPLPADAALVLYRGAQEALTNVARYAPGARTTVVLRYGADRACLSVANDGADPGPATGLSDLGGGHGLTGLRERVERTGGTLTAGPVSDGWRVELEVPA